MKRCIACGAPLWETPLLTLDNMPASAQHMPDAQGVKQDRGLTLDLCQCMGCGLVQFDCEPVDYYRDVIRAGGFSKTMVELARAQGLDVTEGFTETEDTRFAGGLYDVFLSFNFLEHQPDPGTMLQAIYRNLEDDAMGLITVPSFEYIMDHNSYYELIRDHLAYYTFETLTPLLERNGFLEEECEVINRDTLSVIVKKRPQMDTENLLECYVNLKREMESYMKYLDAWDKKVAVWGASHQGFTLASTTKLGERARYIIDSAPFKQGKFAPASHLPIVGPDHFHEHPVDAIIITAPGYTDEIAASIRRKFGTSVEIRAMRSNHLEMV